MEKTLKWLFNDGLIRSTYRRNMEDAYKDFVKAKNDYYALISERARKTWDRRQKERISDEL